MGDTEAPTLPARPPSLHPGPWRVGVCGNAGAEESTARARVSPAGEEMKQRVLLLLSARRHGRAGSAARRSRSRDAARSRAPRASLPFLRQPPTLPCASSRAGGPGARLPPRRGARPVSGLGGASQPLARARRAAVTWRRLGRDVTGRDAARRGCGPASRVSIGRQVDVGRGDRADAGRSRSREVGRARLARLANGWRENLPRRLGPCNQAT